MTTTPDAAELARYTDQVPGAVLRCTYIPAKTAVAFTIAKTNILRVIDVAGQQAADIVMFNAAELEDCVNSETTKLINGTYAPTTRHVIYSVDCNPMFTILEDSVGENYPGAAQCSERLNYIRYGIPGTLNCRSNLAEVLRPWGITERRVPGCFTPFMKVTHGSDGALALATASSGPGDFIDLRAEMDMLIGISACPQERNPVNGWKPTPLIAITYHAAGEVNADGA